ncbi:MAG: hypothetical protein GX477_09160 [Clostridiaceae bacterium]|nr:hypothetical protein [Clostridiaceae bacterium]
MRKITVIRIGKRKAAVPPRQRTAFLRTQRNKKAIIMIALVIPLVFLVILLFSQMDR